MSSKYIEPLLDAGILPDVITRHGIRRQLAQKIETIYSGNLIAESGNLKRLPINELMVKKMEYVKQLSSNKNVIAIETDKANEQHYELPTDFFKYCLGQFCANLSGPRLKYSCALFENGAKTLEEAEVAMLDLYLDRAGIKDEMTILELGCGW